MRLLGPFRLWLLWVVVLALVLAVLLGGPLGLWGGGTTRSPASGTAGAGTSGHDQPDNVDRLLGRCTAVEEALASGDPGRAWSLLEAGKQLVIPALQARWSEIHLRAETALDRALQRLQQEVKVARILAARSLLIELTAGESRMVAQRLDALVRARGWPPRPGMVRGARPGVEVAAAGSELARHRRVRVSHRGGLVDVPVWHVEGEAVTVRVQDQGGVAFPVFDRAMVEPLDPSFAEAADQVRICYRAGEVMAAWLWLCHCLGRSEASQHQQQLAALGQLLR